MFDWLQEKGDTNKMHRVLNCGVGMVIQAQEHVETALNVKSASSPVIG